MIDEIRIAAELETELESDSCVWYGVEVMMMTTADGSGRVIGWAMLTMCSCFRRSGVAREAVRPAGREHSGMR